MGDIDLENIKKEFQLVCNICGASLLVKHRDHTSHWGYEDTTTVIYCPKGCGECEL